MFRQAYAKARHYTRPVVGVTRTVGGKCTSGIASFVIINREGWILTAYHILKILAAIREIQLKTQAYSESLASIRSDTSLSSKKAEAKIKALGPPPAPEGVEHCAVWWGSNDAKLVDAGGIEDIDLGVGRLEPFDPGSIAAYPVMKTTSKNYEPGVSLCKLGYPFYEVPVAWDGKTSNFTCASPDLAFPLFPIEGILTRFVRDPTLQGRQPYALAQLETSSPGLRGQSGGPIFDTRGRLWGIQTATAHLPLGFQPEFMEHGKMPRQQQFLNVGRGVHGETIQGLLNQLGIKFELSKD
jgi:trypsin-like peptidase